MAIRFACTQCGKKYEVEDKFAGRGMACKGCGARLSVPGQAQGARPAQAAAAEAGAPGANPPARTATPLPQQADPDETGVAQPRVKTATVPAAVAPAGNHEHAAPVSAAPSSRQPAAGAPYDDDDADDEPELTAEERRAAVLARAKRRKIENLVTVGVILLVGIVAFAFIVTSAMGKQEPSPDNTVAADDDNDNDSDVPRIRPVDINEGNAGNGPDENVPEPEPLAFAMTWDAPRRIWTYTDELIPLIAVGGSGQYEFEASTPLPEGMVLSYHERKGWRIEGMPTLPGLVQSLVMLRDKQTGETILQECVFDCMEPLALALEVLGDGMVDKPYEHTFMCSGGVRPYKWDLVQPIRIDGLAFEQSEANDAMALVQGTPKSATSRPSVIEVRVTDAEGTKRSYNYTLAVKEPPPEIVRRPPTQGPRPRNPVDGRGQASNLQAMNQEACEHMSNGTKLIEDGRVDEGVAEYREAITIFEKMLEIDPANATAHYNLACAYSLGCDVLTELKPMENLDKALDHLEQAVLNGYQNFQHLQRDGDLKNLRDRHPDFKSKFGDREAFVERGAEATLAALKREYGDTYLYHIDRDRKLIFATNQSQSTLDYLIERLTNYAEAQWEHLFPNKPDHYISVILPSKEDFRARVPDQRIGGYYSPGTRQLICGNIGSTLTHEFTHALHFADLAYHNVQHNMWMVEGLATCFEDSEMKDGVPTPYANARLPGLQQALARNQLPTMKRFMEMAQPEFMDANAGLHYAHCRYICVWLWEQDLLKKFYDLYCDARRRDRSGVKAMEELLGKTIEQCDEEWKEWVRSLPPYVSGGRVDPNAPYLGIGFDQSETGLVVTRVADDSPAARGGLKLNDTIIEVAGRVMNRGDQLNNALKEYKPGDLVKFVVIRGETPTELAIRLGTRPRG